MVESLHKRLLLISLACIMAFNLMVPAALGDEGGGGSHDFGGSYPIWGTVWYQNTTNDSDNMFGVVANTNWDAALFCLGFNDGSDDFSNLFTPAIKTKLLTGNNAYQQFANKFKVGKPEMGGSGIVGGIFSPEIDFAAAWSNAKELYGETYCYSARYGVAERSAARTFVEQVLSEGDDSGGDVESAGDAFTYNNYTYVPLLKWADGWSYSGLTTIGTTSSYYSELSEYAASQGYKVYGFITEGGGNNEGPAQQPNYVSFWLIALNPDTFTFDEDSHSISFSETYNTKVIWDYCAKNRVGNRLSTATVPDHGTFKYMFTSSKKDITLQEGTFNMEVAGYTDGKPNRWDLQPIYYASEVGGNNNVTDPEPPITWPNPPTPITPNPPEVPTPPDPTPPEPPDPTPPDPPTPWVPIPGPDDDPITGDEFQDLIDALAEHCQHIRDAMSGNFEQLWTNQSDLLVTEFASTRDTLTDNLQWLGNDIIAQGFTDLNGYLNDLFQWLADQFEFSVNVDSDPYDDTNVLYWLKRIWSKLGTGDINIRPTDPVTDNDEWWSWLLQLMDNFVGFLLGFGLDKLGDVGSALQSLTGKFPFSLPWDLAALFGLLVAPPQTPAVDFPCYTVGLEGIQQVGTYHLSLESYNDAWEQVRWLERVSFCILLIKSSDFFTSLLGKVFGK